MRRFWLIILGVVLSFIVISLVDTSCECDGPCKVENAVSNSSAHMKKYLGNVTLSPRGETPVFSELLSNTYELRLGSVDTKYDRAARELHWRESRCGRDKRYLTTWPEAGEYQATPIWRLDFYMIFGREARVYGDEMAEDVADWLWHWDHQSHGGQASEAELVRMYQEGPGR